MPAHAGKQEWVVISSTTTGDLSWLATWQHQLVGIPVLVVHEAGLSISQIPTGISLSFITRSSIQGIDTAQLSLLDVAVLSCTQEQILFLEEGCVPATDSSSWQVNVLSEHAYNLNTPSTPYFFNTLYDPYRSGTDFVRGYPFSLREGVPTALSHGLWLCPSQSATPEQSEQPQQQRVHYADATLTVPKEALCAFSARNLAVSRRLAGVALYSGPYDGGADSDFTWASYCIKAVCNHCGYGCKTGLPYVSCPQPNASSMGAGMQQQQPAAQHQEAVMEFFRDVRLSDNSKTPQQAYVELATQVRVQLGKLDPYFIQLAAGMEAWEKAFSATCS